MDVAAAVVGLLVAGAQVGSVITKLISAWKDAPALARKLDTEVTNFRYILSKIQQTVLGDGLLDRDRASKIDRNHLSRALTAAVYTFSELERELGRIEAPGKMDFWDRMKWGRAEKTLNNLSLRLSKHETSFTLIFTILTSESLTEITSCVENLRNELASESATLAVDINEPSTNDDSSTIHTVHSTVSFLSLSKRLLLTRPYRRAQNSNSKFSIDSSSTRKGRWSSNTACSNDSVLRMPISLREEAGETLAGGSIATVLLPITLDTLFNHERYPKGPEEQVNPNIGVISTPKFALHLAAEKGRHDEVQQLLHRGMDVNMKNEQNRTALQLAFFNRHERTVQHLLIHKADADATDADNRTPLHMFAITGKLDVISILLKRGVDINAQDKHGETPVHYAARHGHVEILKILVQHGAKIDYKNEKGLTPILLSLSQETFYLLLQAGASTSTRDEDGLTLLHRAALYGDSHGVSLLLKHGAENGATDALNTAPIHCAVTNGHKDVVGLLLKDGADIEAKQSNGKTPLFLAIEGRYEAIVSVLLAHKVLVNTTDSRGITPLMLAARGGWEVIAITLVERGADCNAKDCNGRTPLHYAAFEGLEGLVTILHQRGADKDAADDDNITPRDLARDQTIVHLIESWSD